MSDEENKINAYNWKDDELIGKTMNIEKDIINYDNNNENDKYTGLEKRLFNSQKECDRKESIILNFRQKNKQNIRNINILNGIISEKDKEIFQSKEENNSLNEINNKLRSQMLNLIQENKNIFQNIKKIQNDTNKEIENLKQENTCLLKSEKQAKILNSNYLDEYENFKANYKTLEAYCKKLREENISLSKSKEQMFISIQENENKINFLECEKNKEIEILNKENDSLVESEKSTNGKFLQLMAEYKSLQAELIILKENLEKIKRNNSDLESIVIRRENELIKKIQENENFKDKLKRSIQNLHHDFDLNMQTNLAIENENLIVKREPVNAEDEADLTNKRQKIK